MVAFIPQQFKGKYARWLEYFMRSVYKGFIAPKYPISEKCIHLYITYADCETETLQLLIKTTS